MKPCRTVPSWAVWSHAPAVRIGRWRGIYRLHELRSKRFPDRTDYAGTALGVGTGKIVGVIHAATIKIQGSILTCKLTVMEDPNLKFIFGMDNMRSHACIIDVKKNCILFPFAKISAQFLSDGEINKYKLNLKSY